MCAINYYTVGAALQTGLGSCAHFSPLCMYAVQSTHLCGTLIFPASFISIDLLPRSGENSSSSALVLNDASNCCAAVPVFGRASDAGRAREELAIGMEGRIGIKRVRMRSNRKRDGLRCQRTHGQQNSLLSRQIRERISARCGETLYPWGRSAHDHDSKSA